MSLFDPLPEITTPRLRLRCHTLDDAEGMFATRTHPVTIKFVGKPPPASVDAMREKIATIIAALKAEEGLMYALDDRETGAYLGSAGLWRWDKPHYRAEVGYELLPSAWGRGLMPEALAPIIAMGWRLMKLHSIEAKVNPENAASIRVLEKLGFGREAYFRENHFNGVAFEDSAVYSLLAPR